MIICQSVALICLWGTLVGSMLPLVFKRLGFDPGYASSPFVATFVDVTGIIIFFSIAELWYCRRHRRYPEPRSETSRAVSLRSPTTTLRQPAATETRR